MTKLLLETAVVFYLKTIKKQKICFIALSTAGEAVIIVFVIEITNE